MKPSTQSGGSGHRPGLPIACESPDDPRLEAFADFVAAYDARDWKAGQLATRRLRALGFSVVLTKPSGSGGAA